MAYVITCSICLEDLCNTVGKGNPSGLICGHVFHKDCIFTWFHTGINAYIGMRCRCPICQKYVPFPPKLTTLYLTSEPSHVVDELKKSLAESNLKITSMENKLAENRVLSRLRSVQPLALPPLRTIRTNNNIQQNYEHEIQTIPMNLCTNNSGRQNIDNIVPISRHESFSRVRALQRSRSNCNLIERANTRTNNENIVTTQLFRRAFGNVTARQTYLE